MHKKVHCEVCYINKSYCSLCLAKARKRVKKSISLLFLLLNYFFIQALNVIKSLILINNKKITDTC